MVSGLAPGKRRGDLDGREVDRRQRRDRQQPIGEDAEHDQRRRDQRRHHRTADAGFGDVHVRLPALGGATVDRACRCASSSWPSVTTVSPPASPSVMTVSSPTYALDLDRLHLGHAVLDDEHEVAGLADLHGAPTARPPPPPRATSARWSPACPATAARRSFGMVARTVTMPVVGIDGVLDHRDLAAGVLGVARHDRLDGRGLGGERPADIGQRRPAAP